MRNAMFQVSFFLLVLSSGGVLPIMLGGPVFFILILLLLIFIFLSIPKFDAGMLTRAGIFFSLSVALLTALQLINTGVIIDAEFPQFLFRFFIAWLMAVCTYQGNLDLGTALYRIMLLIGVHALFNFLLQFVLTPFLTTLDLKDILKVQTFMYVFFYQSTHELGGMEFFRNQGLFWEPGVLMIYMNLLFYVGSFIRKQKWVSIFAALMVLTTFSTTGLILLAIQLLVLFKSVIKKNLAYIFPVLIVSLLLTPLILSNISSKFQDDNGSFIVRSFDYVMSLTIIGENWLKGIGFGTAVYEKAQIASSFFQSSLMIEPRRNSNSITAALVAFGIPIGILLLRMLFRQQVIGGNRWLVFTILFIGLNSEPLIFTGFFLYCIITGGMLYDGKATHSALRNRGSKLALSGS